MNTKHLKLVSICLATISLVACNMGDSGSGSTSSSSSTITATQSSANQLSGVNNFKISLVDKPKLGLLEVWVNIDHIELVVEGKNKKGRIILDKNLGLIDLLKLQSGVSLDVAEIELPQSVQVKEIRVLLDDRGHWALKDDLSKCDLRTPSAQQSGLKMKLNSVINIESKSNYNMVIDFDANKSVVQLGNGDCLLKPVIKIKSLEQVKEVDNNTEENDVSILDNVTNNTDLADNPVVDTSSNTVDQSTSTTTDSTTTSTTSSSTDTSNSSTSTTTNTTSGGLVIVTDPITGQPVWYDPASGEYIIDPSLVSIL